MGGPRAATDRKRFRGETCCFCERPIDPPYPGKERPCDACALTKPREVVATERVFVEFRLTGKIWIVTYKHVTLRKEIGKPSRFDRADMVRRLYERAAETRNLEAENLMEIGLRGGRGGFWIKLTIDEYRRLCATLPVKR
jgi:hypothetical protein